MSAELTQSQLKALDACAEFPPRVVNPRTNETFVLIPAEMYERVHAILADEDEIQSIRETYPLVGGVLAGDDAASSSKESA